MGFAVGDLRPFALFRSNADLSFSRSHDAQRPNLADLRKSVPIAVIDDEPFLPEKNLRSYGYSIHQLGDVKRIEEVKDYQIVLCDLMGVGTHFDEARQGASLIEEVRKHYPSTIVIAYSGSALSSAPARAAKVYADRLLRKDIDNAEWRDVLDGFISDVLDPHFVWARVRTALIEHDIDTKQLLVLEDSYVRAVLAKDKRANDLMQTVSRLDLSSDVRSIINGLIASAIFALILA